MDWLALGRWTIDLVDRLMPALVTAGMAFFIFNQNRLRDLRKVSMDNYAEFYAEKLADDRYQAELFLEANGERDWSETDPYLLSDPEGRRRHYAAVTRYWARLATIWDEEELDRRLTGKLLGYSAGYWWGVVYEPMTKRANMYTGPAIRKFCEAMRDGAGSEQFNVGYEAGERLREERRIEAVRRIAISDAVQAGLPGSVVLDGA